MPKKAARRIVVSKSTQSYSRGLDGLIPFQLRRAQEASFNAYARRVGAWHIWPGWYAILVIIHDNPGITQTTLSAVTRRDKSTLTASLRELRKLAMIKRSPHPTDGRSFELSLTDQGREHLRILSKHARLHERLVDKIVGAENREALVKILRNLADELNKR